MAHPPDPKFEKVVRTFKSKRTKFSIEERLNLIHEPPTTFYVLDWYGFEFARVSPAQLQEFSALLATVNLSKVFPELGNGGD